MVEGSLKRPVAGGEGGEPGGLLEKYEAVSYFGGPGEAYIRN